jgi:hypothetical protein
MDDMDNAPPPGKYREVGRNKVPENHVYPMETADDRALFSKRLRAMERGNAALCPIAYIPLPGRRVMRFRTLEEANADQDRSMRRLAELAAEKGQYVVGR